MAEKSKQKLAEILSKSPKLIGQDSSFFGSVQKPNEGNIKIFMKFTRTLKNSGQLSKETVDSNTFLSFLHKNNKSEDEIKDIKSKFTQLLKESQIVETETESTLFDLGEALLNLGVKGKDSISKFQVVLGDLSLNSNINNLVKEQSSEANSEGIAKNKLNLSNNATTVNAEPEKAVSSTGSSSYSSGGASTITVGQEAKTTIKSKSTTKGTTVIGVEETLKKHEDLDESLKEKKPKEVTNSNGELIGFITEEENNNSLYNKNGEVIGSFENKNGTINITRQQSSVTNTENKGVQTIPTESLAGKETQSQFNIPTGLERKETENDTTKSGDSKPSKQRKKRLINLPGRGRKLVPQLTAIQRADIKKQETKAAEDPIFLISRKKTSSSKSTINKKRKSNIGKITLGSSLGLGGIINSTTASTMAADVFQTIIQLIT